jgi:hypothetical protein
MSASKQASGAGSPVAGGRYLEDFAVGQTYGSGRLRVDEERIKSFAAEFDPQPFHLNAEAARKSILGGLAASGWHTAALAMRLLVESDLKPAGGIVGVGSMSCAGRGRYDRRRVAARGEVPRCGRRNAPATGLIKVRATRATKGRGGSVLAANLMAPRRSSDMP